MTTPNSTTEAGALADDEIGAAWDAVKARMSHDPYTPKEAFWAGALFAASRPVAGALPEVPDARTFNAMQRPGWAATSDWNRGWDACRSVFAAVNGLATPSPAQAEPTGEAAEQRANLDRYLKSNYPNAKGNSVTARAIHALEEMDVALGMKDMEAGKFTAEPTGATEGAEPTADAERLDLIASEYLTVRAFDISTGGGDADVGWELTQWHQGEAQPREVYSEYRDDLRAAIDGAMAVLRAGKKG